MRGSGGSFGIVTSIEVTTYPVPPSATLFQYSWDLSVTDAANALAALQSFVQTDIPPEFSLAFEVRKGSTLGRVVIQILGGWYGPADGLNTTIAPFLNQIPSSPQTILTVGTYIDTVAALGVVAGSPTLNTSSMPETPDTCYSKSIMTPEGSPITTSAMEAFMKYLAHEGYSSTLVCQCAP
jgi:hypothetical protein